MYVNRYVYLASMSKKLTSIYVSRSLAERGVSAFRDDEFARLFRLPAKKTHEVLHRLASAGIVRRLANGRYVVAGLGPSPAEAQPFYLGTRLVEPSYVSFWSALHYYGWTEQAPRLVFLATARVSGRRSVGSFVFRYVKLRSSRFFGYAAVRDGALEFPVAEPEKAIVDSLFLPEAAGGMGHLANVVGEAHGGLDVSKLEAYAARMGVRSLASRLGYLLARSGVRADGLASLASSVYIPLDPRGPRRGRYVRDWKVIDNLTEAP